jgi:multidrug transporter EmrE-like cation transporter
VWRFTARAAATLPSMAIEVPPPEAIHPTAAPPSSPAVNLISLLLLIVSITFSVAGQFTLKRAMNEVGRIGSEQVAEAGNTIVRVAKEPRLWLGLTLFGISAVFWLVVLSRVDLSVAYPLVGLSYIVVVLFSKLFLQEQVTALRWLGVLVIALGITLVGLSFKGSTGT